MRFYKLEPVNVFSKSGVANKLRRKLGLPLLFYYRIFFLLFSILITIVALCLHEQEPPDVDSTIVVGATTKNGFAKLAFCFILDKHQKLIFADFRSSFFKLSDGQFELQYFRSIKSDHSYRVNQIKIPN